MIESPITKNICATVTSQPNTYQVNTSFLSTFQYYELSPPDAEFYLPVMTSPCICGKQQDFPKLPGAVQ